MWQYDIDKWMIQNDIIYGTTYEDQQAKKNQQIDAKVRLLHQAEKKKGRHQGMYVFDTSITKKLEQVLDRKQKGIISNKEKSRYYSSGQHSK